MDERQLFTETVKKMKRLDFLSDFVRRKNAEKSKLSDEVAVYRKKNGSVGNKEYDIAIFQLNAKISDIEKSVDKCKIEMKTLKGSISEALRECYAKADNADFLKRVRLAYKHVFGERNYLVGVNEVGGIFGDVKIIGAMVTHDKTKRAAVQEFVRAGEKNQAGKIISYPEIVVWDYDKTRPEGEFRTEDDSFKTELKKKKDPELLKFVKDTYKKPLLYKTTAFFVALVVMFALAAVSGVIGNEPDKAFIPYFIIGAIALVSFSVFAAKSERTSSVIDGASLAAFGFAIVTGVRFAAVSVDERVILPIFLVVYSLAVFILRFTLRKKEKSGIKLAKPVACFIGGFFALALSRPDTTEVLPKVFVAAVYFALVAACLLGGAYAIFAEKTKADDGENNVKDENNVKGENNVKHDKNEKYRKIGGNALLFLTCFAGVATLVSPYFVGMIISAAVAAVSVGAYSYLRLKNEI